MAKSTHPLDIMNLLGGAAHRKAQVNTNPEDEEDSLNSMSPKAKSPPQSVKSKKVAAIKEQEKGNGKLIPNKANG